MSTEEIGLLMTAAGLFGALMAKAFKASKDWLNRGYVSKDTLRDRELEEVKKLVAATADSCNRHITACNETPPTLILAEIEHLTDTVNAHISDDKRMFEHMGAHMDKIRDVHTVTLEQILAAVRNRT